MEAPVHSGKVLGGRYALGQRLGAGGWGSVYAAVQSDLGRPVAVKVLHANVALSSEGLARFAREARSAAALGHPNIAQVTDFQANPGEPPFLVMELLTGQTLGAALKTSPRLAPGRMAWIAYQILAGLDVAHRAGIVHRDIKPDNVFLVAMPGVEDHVKLLDFGIAKLSDEGSAQLTATGTLLGSPAFMAPEQVMGGRVDARVDIYALGATMYLALSGRMPFEANSMHALLLAITEQPVPPLHALDPAIDPALSALVERAMHKDPAARYASAEAMRAALQPWLGGVNASASATAQAPRVVSPASMTSGPGPNLPGPNLPGPSMPGPYLPGPYLPTPAHQATSQPAPALRQGMSSGMLVMLLVGGFGLLLLLAIGGAGFYLLAGRGASSVSTGGSASASDTAASPGGRVAGAAASNAAASNPAVAGGAGAAGGAAPGGAAAGGAAASGAGARPRATAGAATTASPVAASPTTPVPASLLTDAGGGAVPAAVPAPGAFPKKQFAGSTNWRVDGGTFETYDIAASKAAIMKLSGPISACYVKTEFEAPDHQFTTWTFQVDPAGNVKSVRRTTEFDPHPSFDACMIAALRQVKWSATANGGSPHVSFSARTRDNP